MSNISHADWIDWKYYGLTKQRLERYQFHGAHVVIHRYQQCPVRLEPVTGHQRRWDTVNPRRHTAQRRGGHRVRWCWRGSSLRAIRRKTITSVSQRQNGGVKPMSVAARVIYTRSSHRQHAHRLPPHIHGKVLTDGHADPRLYNLRRRWSRRQHQHGQRLGHRGQPHLPRSRHEFHRGYGACGYMNWFTIEDDNEFLSCVLR